MVKIRKSILGFHRWISLIALIFWTIQALTGLLIVFHWEISDALLPGKSAPVDFAAIERRIDSLTPPSSGRSVGSVWESGDVADRYDLYLDGPEGASTIRINGTGDILRTRADGEMIANGGWVDTLVVLHHELLGGDTGSWIVGISALLLLSNLILGLILGWPRRGSWLRTLRPPAKAGGAVARLYGWHRTIGLWGVLPAFATVAAAAMMIFGDVTQTVVRPDPVEAPVEPSTGGIKIGLAQAVSIGLELYPDARISGISLPTQEDAKYRLRLNRDGDGRRIYGTTTVYLSAVDGRVMGNFDALNDGAARSFVDGLFPFHTGEMGGTAGRIAMLGIALWLLTMIALGFLLWRRRRA